MVKEKYEKSNQKPFIPSNKKTCAKIIVRRMERINMEIKITEKAAQKINEKISDKKGFLKLKYDTEGCGCVVSGIAALWFVSELDDDDEALQTDGMPIYIEKSKAVFFDEQMKIDFTETYNCFQLKSPNQIINGRMSFWDKTK
jgi:uncharacterized protein YqkB